MNCPLMCFFPRKTGSACSLTSSEDRSFLEPGPFLLPRLHRFVVFCSLLVGGLSQEGCEDHREPASMAAR